MAELMQDNEQGTYVDIIDLTADVVRAHVSRSDVPPEMLRTLILEVHSTLRALADPAVEPVRSVIPAPPAVVIASMEGRAQHPPSHPMPAGQPDAPVPRPASVQPAPEPPQAISSQAQPAPEPPVPPASSAASQQDARPEPAKPQRTTSIHIPRPLAQLPDEDDEEPSVPTDRSVTADGLIDLESGSTHRDLGRFLSKARGESPDSYRRKFGLPPEYPMMAPRLIRTKGRVSELDPRTFRRLTSGPVERDARFDGEAP